MSDLQSLSQRRQVLIDRAAQQRAQLVAACGQLQRPAAIFDKGYAVASRIKEHPGIAMGAVAVVGLMLVKRGAVGKVAGVALKAAGYAVPLVKYWLGRRSRAAE